MVKVNGLGGVFIYANNTQALAEWYTQHFGLEFLSYYEPDESQKTYYLEFYYRADAEPDKRLSTVLAIRPAKETLGNHRNETMINYRVDDLDGFIAQLKAKEITVDPVENLSFGRFTWLEDPEGNRIELYQPL